MESPEFSFCSPENRLSGDHFVVEDLLDFSNDVDDDRVLHHGFTPGNSTDSASTVVDSCNSSFSGGVGGGGCDTPFAGAGGFGGDGHFSGDDLGVPYDDMAQLEWLSNFVEESFSSDDLKIKTQPDPNPEPNSDPSILISDPTRPNTTTPLPGKARSKRSRSGPGNWISRLLVVTPETTSSQKPKKKPMSGSGSRSDQDPNGEIRRCLHCATDKTPQWRTGPMGPKTLCNACGVRYKSGRLVPEYRPASSPTFVLTKHSNSHRKVMELRRQKEVQRQQVIREQLIRDPSMGFDPNNNTGGGGGGDGYLIHHHMGPDFRQLI